jgi:type IV secretory pathway TrbD component
MNIIRWLATTVILSGAIMAALGFVPQCFLLLSLGSVLWSFVAYKDRDHPLFVLNATMTVLNIIAYVNN